MVKVRICEDLEEARHLWCKFWPKNHIFDLWEVRKCFQDVFNHKPHFLVAEEDGVFAGLLALSWMEAEDGFGHFPGETWQGRTWLEQNRILAKDAKILRALVHHVPHGTHMRYLTRDALLFGDVPCVEDEVGYLFYPKQYDYCFENYFSEFSSKSRKKITRELDKFENAGVSYRYDQPADMERMFQMNREAYGGLSYFSDPAFYPGFRKLLLWLEAKNMLRLTTVLINGEVAAIDVGAVYHSTYTVLAGGVNREFPGIAKLINFHHLKWACQKQFKTVDFLCGDYGWKERFHLTPRPLYKMERPAVPAVIRRPGFALYATA